MKVLVEYSPVECEPWLKVILMDDLFPFAVTPIVSPQRPQPHVDDSDDEFALPSSSTKKSLDPTIGTASNATSLGLQTPSRARDAVDGGSSLRGGEAEPAGDGTERTFRGRHGLVNWSEKFDLQLN